MDNFSIYRYMHLGIVHFKAFPQVVGGQGPIVETLRKIAKVQRSKVPTFTLRAAVERQR